MKRRTISLCIVCLIAASFMAAPEVSPLFLSRSVDLIAVDANCTSSASGIPSTLTCSLTHAAFVFVLIVVHENTGDIASYSTPIPVSSVTVGKHSAVQILPEAILESSAAIGLWGVYLTSSGTDTVTINLPITGTSPGGLIQLEAESFTGVSRAKPFEDAAQAYSASCTVNLCTLSQTIAAGTANRLIVYMETVATTALDGVTSCTAGSGETQLYCRQTNPYCTHFTGCSSGTNVVGNMQIEAASGQTTMSVTTDGQHGSFLFITQILALLPGGH